MENNRARYVLMDIIAAEVRNLLNTHTKTTWIGRGAATSIDDLMHMYEVIRDMDEHESLKKYFT